MDMSVVVTVGYLGTLVLILAWIWAAYKDAKEHKVAIDIDFSLLYIVGNSLLLLYAIWINNMVFIVLEIFLVAAIFIETVYAIKSGKRVHKSKRKRR